jgi:hypothetical protein
VSSGLSAHRHPLERLSPILLELTTGGGLRRISQLSRQRGFQVL